MKIIIWGLGAIGKKFLQNEYLYKNDTIVAFVDNNAGFWGKKWGDSRYKNISVICPMQILDMVYDRIIICTDAYVDVRKQLINELHIDADKIVTYYDVQEKFRESIIEKYALSSDKQILKVIDYYRSKGLNVYGYYEERREEFQIYYDNNNNKYTLIANKRMYFPKDYPTYRRDGKQYAHILYDKEQGNGSPHLYVKNEEEVRENAVIVDAGACEGGFALQYIEKAKKVYLIESEPEWVEALKLTFQPYKDKVVFCDRFLTRYNSRNTITLDTLINEPIDFLKMDIEGAEIDALLGAKGVLENSNARCAICSYHKQNDEENIRFVLEAMGYQTTVSDGYMLFLYDENIADTLDLRKGIVYGKKKGHV